MSGAYEAVIGLEVHCQLATESKIFCGCPAKPPTGVSVADVEVNAHTCPVCTGHPGSLPVLNQKVLEFAVTAGLATNCTIHSRSVFARKNYFYPDLPKGYQISQFDRPICTNGKVVISSDRTISIQRIHIEEDAGKNVHLDDCSLVNLNRAGVPLVEIVSAPDLKTPQEAGTYLRELHAIVTATRICDGNMQEGNFRCDANVSVRPIGQKEFGTRVEIKNVNSFRFVEKAIEYEIERQTQKLMIGEKVVQETRLYDSVKNRTFSMRSKEEAEDYRYFPDPDLHLIEVSEKWISDLRAQLPELPAQKRWRFIKDFGLKEEDARLLASDHEACQIFEETVLGFSGKENLETAAKHIANFLMGEGARLTAEHERTFFQSGLKASHLLALVKMILDQTLSISGAKQVFGVCFETGEAAGDVVEKLGLRQVSDTGELEKIVDSVIQRSPHQVKEFQEGKEKLLGFFVGQVMKDSKGKANPGVITELIKTKLSKS